MIVTFQSYDCLFYRLNAIECFDFRSCQSHRCPGSAIACPTSLMSFGVMSCVMRVGNDTRCRICYSTCIVVEPDLFVDPAVESFLVDIAHLLQKNRLATQIF